MPILVRFRAFWIFFFDCLERKRLPRSVDWCYNSFLVRTQNCLMIKTFFSSPSILTQLKIPLVDLSGTARGIKFSRFFDCGPLS
ncbi:hypothetical protein PILCRDRAFT_615657 [Piloderma croceum F 1598]|uniref:Uncharacterized protein n=1 Tax=Piloderma croceum (strain F 1598) TaxID=765440 RepID=A0A0C3EYQ4_PILCF|nr:hypothetical protein PILCRDRAFT_615657 [Piloderma croceum F 1598]